MIGEKFGKLLVIEKLGRKWSTYLFKCQCECGKIIEAAGSNLKRGHTKSCGCSRQKVINGISVRNLPEYQVWMDMKTRCYNEKSPAFKYYGARGISISENWRNNFATFYRDMGERPEKMTIERIDNNLGYCKENCRWASWSDNLKNRRGWK